MKFWKRIEKLKSHFRKKFHNTKFRMSEKYFRNLNLKMYFRIRIHFDMQSLFLFKNYREYFDILHQ